MTANQPSLGKANIFRVLIGAVLVVILLVTVDLQSLWHTVSSVEPWHLFFAFTLFSSQSVLEAERLRRAFASYRVSWGEGLRLFFIGLFFGNFLPGTVGADIYQVQQMHSRNGELIQPVTLSLALRFSGFITNAFMLVTSLVFYSESMSLLNLASFGDTNRDDTTKWIGVIIIVGILGLALMAIAKRKTSVVCDKFQHSLKTSIRALLQIQKKSIVVIFVLGIVIVLVRAGSVLVLLFGLGDPVTPIIAILSMTLTALVMILPISISSLGVRELTLAGILHVAGVSLEAAVAVALITRLFLWALSLIGAGWFILNRRIAGD